MKLLILLNESPEGSHKDIRGACEYYIKEKVIDDYRIFPFLAKIGKGIANGQIINEIATLARDFQPELVLWCHTTKLSVPKYVIDEIKDLPSKPSTGYWDGDIFQFFWQFLPKNTFNVARYCDVSFCQGIGYMARKIKRGGCKDIRFVPAFTDEIRFTAVREKSSDFEYDVILIGNNWKNKIRIQFPGCRMRNQISKLLYKKLGNRYALFGEGWKGPYVKGPLPFNEQNAMYAKSRIMIGTNSKHEAYYFSNRLPIAMSSGIVIVHNYEKGFEEVFSGFKHAFFFKNAKEALTIIEELLEKSNAELAEISEETRQYALEHFSVEKVMGYMIDVLKDHKVYIDSENTDLNIRKNPWIKMDTF